MDTQTNATYESHGAQFAERYETMRGSTALLRSLFSRGESVLDVGVGSGRDLAHLISLGCDAWGMEPAAAFRAEATHRHPELAGRILTGSLPDDLPVEFGSTAPRIFDGITMCAVLMHIPESEFAATAEALFGLLRPGGTLLLSFCVSRPGSDPDTGRDPSGRLFLLRSSAEIQMRFQSVGFAVRRATESPDDQGRPGITWGTLVLSRE